MSQFPIRAPSPAGCEWEGWQEEGNTCLYCLEPCLRGAAGQVAYGNKDYAAGLCVFGRELSSLGQRRNMRDHVPSRKQNCQARNAKSTAGRYTHNHKQTFSTYTHVWLTPKAIILWDQVWGTDMFGENKRGDGTHTKEDFTKFSFNDDLSWFNLDLAVFYGPMLTPETLSRNTAQPGAAHQRKFTVVFSVKPWQPQGELLNHRNYRPVLKRWHNRSREMALRGNEGKGLKGACVLAREWTQLGGLMYMCLCVELGKGTGWFIVVGPKAGSHATYM